MQQVETDLLGLQDLDKLVLESPNTFAAVVAVGVVAVFGSVFAAVPEKTIKVTRSEALIEY